MKTSQVELPDEIAHEIDDAVGRVSSKALSKGVRAACDG